MRAQRARADLELISQTLNNPINNGQEALPTQAYLVAIAVSSLRNKRAATWRPIALGGPPIAADFADHAGTFVDPVAIAYRSHRVHECPPNEQGVAALMVLGVLNPRRHGSALACLIFVPMAQSPGLALRQCWCPLRRPATISRGANLG